eukprot:CAMPEP_0176296890 /NCGR_PEP_ID=MMETSP0121_2-20121125/58434_1 /TAXON_ID=160619 /ORGANISM="Kryptoperidinium foliaceum, Strain CCMP 1326" /LENGTH=82 /DNA_ID=CAMNT_0017638051 /DNA_START=12 /DNA_END=257 /DNA_ORIENTATION=-
MATERTLARILQTAYMSPIPFTNSPILQIIGRSNCGTIVQAIRRTPFFTVALRQQVGQQHDPEQQAADAATVIGLDRPHVED